VSPVKYERVFISQQTALFIVTAVKTSDLTYFILKASQLIKKLPEVMQTAELITLLTQYYK
jgi:hypothetical protein